MPGIATIEDYYSDVQHIRAGLPAFSVATLFFAAIYEERPDSLDFAVYNDAASYGEADAISNSLSSSLRTRCYDTMLRSDGSHSTAIQWGPRWQSQAPFRCSRRFAIR